MDLAALAGAHQSRTLPTLDTEYGYAFLVDRTQSGRLMLDFYMDVSSVLGDAYAGKRAKEKLTGIADPEFAGIYNKLQTMELRLRYNLRLSGPYLIRTPDPISIEELASFLHRIKPDDVDTFLEGAKF